MCYKKIKINLIFVFYLILSLFVRVVVLQDNISFLHHYLQMSKYAGSKKREELLICQVGDSRLKQLSTEQICQSEQEQHFIRTDVVIRFQRNTHTLQLYNQRDQEHLKTTHVGGRGKRRRKGFYGPKVQLCRGHHVV